jgi:outer membrane receptor protein involved in Fe transport
MSKGPSDTWGARFGAPLLTTAAALTVSCLLMFGTPGEAHAQTGTITGSVINTVTGQPMPGVQVNIAELQIGTLSDNRGRFMLLNVPVGPRTVSAEFIGFGSESVDVVVPANGTVVADFELRVRAIDVEGIVVTGTAGQARRREIGNSISQITSASIEAAPVSSVVNLLQGRSAGTMMLQSSGQAGSGPMIRLRGNNSPTQNNTPLIYVDGIRIYGDAYAGPGEANQSSSAILDIDPADIERIEIVKGAAASTLYGTEASGGVIQVFTKQGASGTPQWSAAIDQGFNNMPWIGPPKDVNPTGLGFFDCTEYPGCPKSGKWVKNGLVQDYRLAVRGGGQTLTYFISGSIGKEGGVVPTQHSDDWALRANFGFSPAHDLQIRFNSSYAKRDTRWYPDGDNADGHTLNVLRGAADYTPGHDDSQTLEQIVWSHSDHYTTGINATWTQTPAITHRLNVGLDFAETDNENTDPWGYFYTPLGNRSNRLFRHRTLTADYVGTWATSLTGDLESSLSFGGQLFDDSEWSLNGYGRDFAGPGDKVVDSGAVTTAWEARSSLAQGGFFLQELLGFKDRLFITGGARIDGHSSFGENFGWEVYPKVSVAYMISDHGFWPAWWEEMKLRTAFGVSGRAPGAFDALRTWDPVAGDEGKPAVTPANIGNPDLGPEKTREIEVGFEGNLLDAKISYDFTYYNQKTTETLIGVSQIPSIGFAGSQLTNIGEVDNWGTETQLDVGIIRGVDVDWTVGFRFATNKSEVIDLGGQEQISSSIRVGYPLPGLWGAQCQNCDQGLVGVAPVYETEYLGPQYPTWSWGISTNLVLFRRVTLDLLGEYQGGNVMTGGVAYGNSYRWVWPPCQDIYDEYNANGITNLTPHQLGKCIRGYHNSGMWLSKGDFFKLRSVSLNFQVPERFLVGGMGSASLRLSGRNIFTITNSDWLDPEGSEEASLRGTGFRSEWYNLPPYRTFLASLQVNF